MFLKQDVLPSAGKRKSLNAHDCGQSLRLFEFGVIVFVFMFKISALKLLGGIFYISLCERFKIQLPMKRKDINFLALKLNFNVERFLLFFTFFDFCCFQILCLSIVSDAKPHSNPYLTVRKKK
jgi:hypothetical protein